MEAGVESSRVEVVTLDVLATDVGRTSGLVTMFLREEREWLWSMTPPAADAAAAANAGATAFAGKRSTVLCYDFLSFLFFCLSLSPRSDFASRISPPVLSFQI